MNLIKDIDIEQYLLAACLNSPEAAKIIASSGITPADFFDDTHKLAFRGIIAVIQDKKKVSIDSVNVKLIDKNATELERQDISTHLSNVAEAHQDFDNVDLNIEALKNLSARRRISDKLMRSLEELQGSASLDKVVSSTTEVIRTIADSRSVDKPEHIIELLPAFKTELMDRMNNKEKTIGCKTGYTELDNIMREGLVPGEVSLLGGRPGSGKTTAAICFASGAAVRGTNVLFFSLECPKERLMQKLVCSTGDNTSSQVNEGAIDQIGYEKICEDADNLCKLPIYIDDRSNLSADDMWARVAQMKSEHKIDLVILDYLQLLSDVAGSGDTNTSAAIEVVARKLKIMARKEEVHLLALCQLSRKTEYRNDKRPLLSDLRQSGGLEQNADNVWMVYRDDYYKGELSVMPGVVELNICKHRYGQTGIAFLAFEACKSKLGNISQTELDKIYSIRRNEANRDKVLDNAEVF